MAMGYPIRNRNEDILQVFPKALPRRSVCIRGVCRLTVQPHKTPKRFARGAYPTEHDRGRRSSQWLAHHFAACVALGIL